MFHHKEPDIERLGEGVLRVRCAPAMQGWPYHLGVVGFMVFVGSKNFGNAHALELLVIGTIVLVFAALLYKNVVVREELAIFRDGMAVEPYRLDFCCADITAVEVEPEPAWMSYRWRMANFGLGRGQVLIRSASEVHYFGAGLTHAQAHRVARAILDFCAHSKQDAALAVSE